MTRLRGCLWLTAGLVVALIAGLLAYVALQRAVTQREAAGEAGPSAQVVVAARAVSVRARLTAQDLSTREVPVEAIPKGALTEPAEAAGKITLVDLFPGEIILSQRLVDPDVVAANGRTALIIAEDQVLMAIPPADLMSQVGVLKPGDHVDLLFTMQFPVSRGVSAAAAETGEAEATSGSAQSEQKEPATFNLLQNLTIAAIVTAPTSNQQQTGAPKAILLTVSPQDALILKYAIDTGGILGIVLRPPGAEAKSDTRPVDVDYVIDKYNIPTAKGR